MWRAENLTSLCYKYAVILGYPYQVKAGFSQNQRSATEQHIK